MTAPATLKHVHRLDFVDHHAPKPGQPPVLLVQRLLLDGEPVPQDVLFTEFTVQQGPSSATIVTLRVDARDVTVTELPDFEPETGRKGYRVEWAGREWLTPWPECDLEAILATAKATHEHPDAYLVDLKVYVGELHFGGQRD